MDLDPPATAAMTSPVKRNQSRLETTSPDTDLAVKQELLQDPSHVSSLLVERSAPVI